MIRFVHGVALALSLKRMLLIWEWEFVVKYGKALVMHNLNQTKIKGFLAPVNGCLKFAKIVGRGGF